MQKLLGVALVSCRDAEKTEALDNGAVDGDGFNVEDGDGNDAGATISPSAAT